MNNKFLRSLQILNGCLDLIALNGLFFLCLVVFREYELISNEKEYLYFGFILNIIWLATVLTTSLYNQKHILSFERFTRVTLRAYVYLLLGLSIYLFFFRVIRLSRIFLGVVLGLLFVVLLINRFFYLAISHYLRSKNELMSKVMVIGYNPLSKKLVNYLEEDGFNKEIVGYCEEYDNVQELSRYPILSNIDGAMEMCMQHGITEIYSTIAQEQNRSIYKLIQSADDNCIRFKVVPDFSLFMN